MRDLTHAPLSWTPAGWVYLFLTPIHYQKIGFSREPEGRVRAFKALPFDVWVEHAFPVGTRNVETRLLGFFRPRRARGEWFNLGADGIELVKSISAARSTLSLPPAFREPYYRAPYAPRAFHHPWGVVADGFAYKLANLRSERGLSLEALAARTGISPDQLRNYERASAPFLSWHEVLTLAKGLGVGTDAFTSNPRRGRTEVDFITPEAWEGAHA